MRPSAISTIVIKANRLCNLRCPYCYYINAATPSTNRVIALETVDRLYQTVRDYLIQESMPFAFVWHGGEPTLLGLKRFAQFMDLQKKYFDPGRVENAVQTNATLIDDEWCRFFLDYDIKVGVSVDGYKELHDRNRVTVAGEGTYDTVVRNIALMRSHGLEVGVLLVVDGGGDAVRTIASLRDLGIEYCDFLLPMSNNALQELDDDEYRDRYCDYTATGEFLKAAFSTLADAPEPLLKVRLFESIIKNAFGLEHGYLNAGSTNVTENLILEPDGTLCMDADFWQIDRFDLGREYRLERDIHDPSFRFRALEDDLRRLIRDKALDLLPTECQECRVRSLCRASHPASRFGSDGSFDHRSAYCEAMFGLCNEIVHYLERHGYADDFFDDDLKRVVVSQPRGG